MFTNAYAGPKCTLIAFTMVLVGVLPLWANAQENSPADTDTETDVVATTTQEVVVPQPPVSAMPYETEGLLGNKIIGDFVVGPGKLDLTILPGQTKVVEITVSNRTGESRIFEIEAEDATGSNDPSRAVVLLGDDRGPYSLKDYVSVEQTRFELEHNRRARIPVTISIPADAEPGGLYGSLLVSTVAKEAEKGDTAGTAPKSAIIARIGSLFFITIPGDVAKEGKLVDITTVPEKKFFQDGPVQLGILFENTGSVHLAPKGELRVHNMFNEEVGFLELEPWFVMPKSLRLREVTWGREFLFGRYTVTAQINRGYEGIVDEMSYSFWILPWKPLVGVFAVVFVVLFLLRSFFRKFEFKRKA